MTQSTTITRRVGDAEHHRHGEQRSHRARRHDGGVRAVDPEEGREAEEPFEARAGHARDVIEPVARGQEAVLADERRALANGGDERDEVHEAEEPQDRGADEQERRAVLPPRDDARAGAEGIHGLLRRLLGTRRRFLDHPTTG